MHTNLKKKDIEFISEKIKEFMDKKFLKQGGKKLKS